MTVAPPQLSQPTIKQRVFSGTVTKTHENFGFIDDDVFFQTRCAFTFMNISVVSIKACAIVLISSVKGNNPQVGDRVLVEASYNTSMPFKWNATRVQVIAPPQHQTQKILSTLNSNLNGKQFHNKPEISFPRFSCWRQLSGQPNLVYLWKESFRKDCLKSASPWMGLRNFGDSRNCFFLFYRDIIYSSMDLTGFLNQYNLAFAAKESCSVYLLSNDWNVISFWIGLNSEAAKQPSREWSNRARSTANDYRESERLAPKARDCRTRERRSRSSSLSPSRKRSRSPHTSPRRRSRNAPRYSVQIPRVSLDW